jgi:hypothetical protein
MTNHLDKLARRVEGDPFFLACYLNLYAQSEGLGEEVLATVLGCSQETLVRLRLCRAPEPDAEQFQKDIDQIVERFRVHPDVLAQVVRRGLAILQMRGSAPNQGILLAARDVEGKRQDGQAGDQS